MIKELIENNYIIIDEFITSEQAKTLYNWFKKDSELYNFYKKIVSYNHIIKKFMKNGKRLNESLL